MKRPYKDRAPCHQDTCQQQAWWLLPQGSFPRARPLLFPGTLFLGALWFRERERDKELPSPGTRDLSCPFWFLFLTAALWRGWEWLPALSQVPGKQEWKEEGFYFLLPDLPCPSQFSYLTIPNDFVGILR